MAQISILKKEMEREGMERKEIGSSG